MSIIAKKPEGGIGFEAIPAGTYQAVCYGTWDIGIQTRVYNGEEKKVHQVIIFWEINKLIEAEGEYKGKRYVISQRYTLSLHEKATLRKHLESWRGKPFNDKELEGFDIEKLKGVNCLLNIIHNESKGKTYANISAVMKCTEGTKPMSPENDGSPPDWVTKLMSEKLPDSFTNEEPKDDPPEDFFTEDEQQKEVNEDLPF